VGGREAHIDGDGVRATIRGTDAPARYPRLMRRRCRRPVDHTDVRSTIRQAAATLRVLRSVHHRAGPDGRNGLSLIVMLPVLRSISPSGAMSSRTTYLRHFLAARSRLVYLGRSTRPASRPAITPATWSTMGLAVVYGDLLLLARPGPARHSWSTARPVHGRRPQCRPGSLAVVGVVGDDQPKPARLGPGNG